MIRYRFMGFPENNIIDHDQFGKKFQKINKLLDVEAIDYIVYNWYIMF